MRVVWFLGSAVWLTAFALPPHTEPLDTVCLVVAVVMFGVGLCSKE